ncbi:hypothetical protein M0R45_026111 [Rubus argutus]|uniref:Uncharacterized protein n=1 Tax=Rubus argutus TaxID=59490 RepID=A0AAW1WW39_RUBAR
MRPLPYLNPQIQILQNKQKTQSPKNYLCPSSNQIHQNPTRAYPKDQIEPRAQPTDAVDPLLPWRRRPRPHKQQTPRLAIIDAVLLSSHFRTASPLPPLKSSPAAQATTAHCRVDPVSLLSTNPARRRRRS